MPRDLSGDGPVFQRLPSLSQDYFDPWYPPAMEPTRNRLRNSAFAFLISSCLAWDSPPVASTDVQKEAPASAAASNHPEATGQDWPAFLGPNTDARSTEKLPFGKNGKLSAEVLWRRPIGEGYSSPSTAEGRLFFFDRVGVHTRLVALHPETGKEIWKTQYAMSYEDSYGFSNGPRSSPLIEAGKVYTFGVEGRLRCHDAATGRLIWERDTEKDFGVVTNFFGVGSSPVIEGNLLIAMVGGSPPDSPGIQSGETQGNDTGIVAFHKDTGKTVYTLSNELASYSSPVLATIGNRRFGFVFGRGGLVAFEPASGKEDFSFPWRAKKLTTVNAATPVVAGDRVFLTESYSPGGALLQVHENGYKVLWEESKKRAKSLASHWSTPVFHDGYLYGSSGSGRGNAELRSVHLESGKIEWTKPGLGRSSLLYADGHLLVQSENGPVLLIKAQSSGFELVQEWDPWILPAITDGAGHRSGSKTSTPPPAYHSPAWAAPVLSHGTLFLRDAKHLIAVALSPDASP
ncbi:MAG: PQQ-like beta-propeller repeat protein [Deltaproteobacteria bacterium]|nr:PQQ-like beta-propeller repeat protein [Deltaproteobacteria bacterium]